MTIPRLLWFHRKNPAATTAGEKRRISTEDIPLIRMLAGIRTLDLRKVYNSPPPLASGGGFGFGAARAKNSKQPKAEIVALDGISLDISPGEIFGLLGPNGAGKSTTAGILTTRVRPTSGKAWIGEFEVWKEQVTVKRLIGVVAQRPNLDFSLTAREILLFHGAYFGLDSQTRAARADKLLDRFKLADRGNQMVRGFSGGMMQRLSIARAMMHDPQVLFLDEPSAGLDPQTRLLLWEIIREYNQSGKTILLTTHNMEEADALCQRVAIIDHGRNIALGTPAELKASVPGGFLLRLRFGNHSPELLQRLQALTGVREVRANPDSKNDNSADIYADRGGPLVSEIANLASSASVELCDVHISEPSLENLFLHHTGRSLRE
ncbi:MAG: ATP-binding cassette domain-containing protein [Candidatus Sulfotelmatobacter sp.]